MVRLHLAPPIKTAFGAIALVLLLAFVAYSLITGVEAGSKTRIAIALMLALSPVLLWVAISRPVLFPLSVYVMFVPFDNLLGISNFGTLTKLLAIPSGLALLFFMIRHRRFQTPSQAPAFWALLFFWMAMSVFWAIDPTISQTYVLTFAQLFLLYVTISVFPVTKQDLTALLGATVVGATFAAAYGSYLFYRNLDVIAQRLFLNNGQDAIDPNHFAAALILPVAIVTSALLNTRSPIARIALALTEFVLFAGIYASGSRGGMLAIAVTFAYIFWHSRKRLLLAVFAALALGASLLAPVNIWSRFADALASGGEGRTGIWQVGVKAFQQNWLHGFGLGNFPLAYNHTYLSVFEQTRTHWSRGAHNLVIGTAVELGIIGLALTLLAWFMQFRMLKEIPPSSGLYRYRLIGEASVLGLFLAGLFLDMMYEKYLWLAFSICGAVYALWCQERRARRLGVDLGFDRELGPVRNIVITHQERPQETIFHA